MAKQNTSALVFSFIGGFVDSVSPGLCVEENAFQIEVLILKVNFFKEALNSRVWLLALLLVKIKTY